MTERVILLLGSGGHARVVLETLDREKKVAGCLDRSEPRPPWPHNIPWLGSDDYLDELAPDEWLLINCVGSIANTDIRRDVFRRAASKGFHFDTLIHSSALIANDVEFGQACQVMAGAIIQTGARLGENVLVNSGAVIDHDSRIADHVHVAPRVVLSGGVSVGLGAHIGTGAVVRQNTHIGANATIGAGAVVVSNVPAGARYAGNPARPIKSSGADSS